MRQTLLWTSCNSCDHEGVSLSMHLPKAFASYKHDKRKASCHGRIGARQTHHQQAGTAVLAASTRINLSRPVFSNRPCISMRGTCGFAPPATVHAFHHSPDKVDIPRQQLLPSSRTLDSTTKKTDYLSSWLYGLSVVHSQSMADTCTIRNEIFCHSNTALPASWLPPFPPRCIGESLQFWCHRGSFPSPYLFSFSTSLAWRLLCPSFETSLLQIWPHPVTSQVYPFAQTEQPDRLPCDIFGIWDVSNPCKANDSDCVSVLTH